MVTPHQWNCIYPCGRVYGCEGQFSFVLTPRSWNRLWGQESGLWDPESRFDTPRNRFDAREIATDPENIVTDPGNVAMDPLEIVADPEKSLRIPKKRNTSKIKNRLIVNRTSRGPIPIAIAIGWSTAFPIDPPLLPIYIIHILFTVSLHGRNSMAITPYISTSLILKRKHCCIKADRAAFFWKWLSGVQRNILCPVDSNKSHVLQGTI